MFICFVCKSEAHFRGEWSDRSAYTCEAHRDYVRWCHDNDHEYDATGISWDSDAEGIFAGFLEYERRKDLPYKGLEWDEEN